MMTYFRSENTEYFTLLLKRLKYMGCEKNQHRSKCSLHLGGAFCVDVPPNTKRKTLIDLKKPPPQMKGSDVHKQIVM